MADITMCTNAECELAFDCLRFMDQPDLMWQSWDYFDGTNCFVEVERAERGTTDS